MVKFCNFITTVTGLDGDDFWCKWRQLQTFDPKNGGDPAWAQACQRCREEGLLCTVWSEKDPDKLASKKQKKANYACGPCREAKAKCSCCIIRSRLTDDFFIWCFGAGQAQPQRPVDRVKVLLVVPNHLREHSRGQEGIRVGPGGARQGRSQGQPVFSSLGLGRRPVPLCLVFGCRARPTLVFAAHPRALYFLPPPSQPHRSPGALRGRASRSTCARGNQAQSALHHSPWRPRRHARYLNSPRLFR